MGQYQVQILQKVDPDIFIVRCSFCGGRGLALYSVSRDSGKEDLFLKLFEWTKDTPCKLCDGKAVLKIQSDDALVSCAFCRGTGHDPTARPYSSESFLYQSKPLSKSLFTEDRANQLCPKCGGVGARSLTGSLKILK